VGQSELCPHAPRGNLAAVIIEGQDGEIWSKVNSEGLPSQIGNMTPLGESPGARLKNQRGWTDFRAGAFAASEWAEDSPPHFFAGVESLASRLKVDVIAVPDALQPGRSRNYSRYHERYCCSEPTNDHRLDRTTERWRTRKAALNVAKNS